MSDTNYIASNYFVNNCYLNIVMYKWFVILVVWPQRNDFIATRQSIKPTYCSASFEHTYFQQTESLQVSAHHLAVHCSCVFTCVQDMVLVTLAFYEWFIHVCTVVQYRLSIHCIYS